MSAQDRIRWDDIYAKRNTSYPKPDNLLLDYIPAAAADSDARALDLAAGLGQNGLWLAEQGYKTDVMDISRVGLQRARAEMTMRNIRNANLLQVDIDKLVLRRSGLCNDIHDICPESYTIIAVFRYLRRPLLPILKEAICSGGRLVYETFNQHYLEEVPEFNPDFLLEIGELEAAFSDWRFIHYDESSHITQMVAVKP
ncbi:MAG: class I SAM-dependent methyltransferase [Phototrophicaceae bacterium]